MKKIFTIAIKILFWAVLFWTILLCIERIPLFEKIKNVEWKNWFYYIEVVAMVLFLNIFFSDNFNKYLKRDYFNKNDYLMASMALGYSFYSLLSEPISKKMFYISGLESILINVIIYIILCRLWNQAKNHSNDNIEEIKNAPSAKLDMPLGNDDVDLFTRRPFAKQIGRMICSTNIRCSMVVGIFGEWGSGKSSILFMLENFLNSERDVATISFNSWLYKDTSNLCDELFKLISVEITKRNMFEESEILKSIAAYSKKLAEFKVVGSPLSFNLLKDMVETDDGLMQLKKNVGNLLGKINFKIVIIIDDLDRLNFDEIFKVFQLVKLTADFPNIAYVLACDYEKVSLAISKAYYSDSDISMGKDFLEKIIQVPLHISVTEHVIVTKYFIGEVHKICKTEDINFTDAMEQTLMETWNKTIGKLNWTLRKVNRLINVIAITLPIQKEDTNLVDLIFIEALHLVSSEMYNYIIINAEEILKKGSLNRQESIELKSNYNKIVNSSNLDGNKVIDDLVCCLFPMISGLANEEKWNKEKRICSRKYFNNYFLYSVPQDTIADMKMIYFIDQISSISDFDRIKKEFIKLTDGKNYSKAIETLGYVIERSKYQLPVLKNISRLLASKVIKSDEEIFLCMKKVIIATPASYQVEILKVITSEFENFIDAVSLFHYILNSQIGQDKLELTEEEYKEYANYITIILQNNLVNDINLINNDKLIHKLIIIWQWADRENAKKNINFILKLNLIEVFLFSIVKNMIPFDNDKFNIQAYNVLSEMCEPEKIANELWKKYKDIPEDDIKKSDDPKVKIALQFMSTHGMILNE